VLTLEPGNVEAKLLQNEISKKTMASLLTPGPGTKLNSSSNSAPSTPISSYFPGVTTRLGAPGESSTERGGGGGLFGNLRRSATLPLYSSSCASNYGDDDEDMDLDCNGNKEQQQPQLFSQLQMTRPVFDEGNRIPPKPTTAAQFNLDWRKIKGNSETCAQYLKVLEILV
jgi:hypothetical protein